MTDEEIINVVAAHASGEKIQWKHRSKLEWYPFVGKPEWNFAEFDFRVAPEPRKPREWSVHLIREGMITSFPAHSGEIQETIRVREVIEPHRDQRTWFAEIPKDGGVGQIFTDSRQLTIGGELVRVMEVLD